MAPGSSSATTMKRIRREIADIQKEDLGSIKLTPTEDNIHIWRGSIPGPEGSVYEGGVFHVEISLPPDYPFSAPRVVFKTRIYHMNISEQGSICIDILKNNWSPALSLFKVMLSLSSLLTDPNPKDPLVPSIATQYMRSRKIHDNTARQWTELYAKPKPLPLPTAATPSVPPQASVHGVAPPSPSRTRGRRRAPEASTTAAQQAGSSSSSRAGPSRSVASSSSSTPIVIDIDEDEGVRTSASSRGKRKRQDAAPSSFSRTAAAGTSTSTTSSSAQQHNVVSVVDLVDSDDEDQPAARPKKSRTSGGGSAMNSGDVICIED